MSYVTILNESGTILWVSGTIPGIQAEDVVGKPAWHFSAPDVTSELQRNLTRSLAGEEVTHTATVVLRGRPHHFESLWRCATIDGKRLIIITTREISSAFKRLSGKQVEVLRSLVECHSNAETSRRLGISERTVESHLRNIRKTLGIDTRPELIAFALHHLTPL